ASALSGRPRRSSTFDRAAGGTSSVASAALSLQPQPSRGDDDRLTHEVDALAPQRTTISAPRGDAWYARISGFPVRRAQYGVSAQCPAPVTGSSSMPTQGATPCLGGASPRHGPR